jgi:hypothetical protein
MGRKKKKVSKPWCWYPFDYCCFNMRHNLKVGVHETWAIPVNQCQSIIERLNLLEMTYHRMA